MTDQKQSLSYLVIKGGVIVSILKVIERGLSMIRLIILANFLAPQDFGLMGVALLTLTTIDTFSQPGFRQALVQKKENVDDYLNPAWTLLVLRGSILFLVLLLIAPLGARFFEAPQACLLIQVIALSLIFQAFTNIGVVFFQKHLDFHKQFFFHLSGVVVDFVVALTLAILTGSVWSLVFGLLAGHFTRMVISYVIHPFRPRFNLDSSRLKELFNFGKWVLGSGVLVFLITQGDSIVVGKFVGITALGLYQLAYRISNMPATEITHIISQVTFPAYSKLQDNIERLREAYLKVLTIVGFLTIPLASALILFAHNFVALCMSEKWFPLIPVLQVLAIAGLFRSLAATAGPVFYAIGKPKLDTHWQVVRFAIMMLLIFPFIQKWSVSGAAWAVVSSIFVTMLGFGYFVKKITSCNIKAIFVPLVFPLLSSLIATYGVIMAQRQFESINGFIFVLLIMLFSLIYLVTIYIWQKLFEYRIIQLVTDTIKTLKNKI